MIKETAKMVISENKDWFQVEDFKWMICCGGCYSGQQPMYLHEGKEDWWLEMIIQKGTSVMYIQSQKEGKVRD